MLATVPPVFFHGRNPRSAVRKLKEGTETPPKGSRNMGSFNKQINRLLHAAIAVCLTCMATFVFANVILRYFFNEGLTWAEEASRYLFIWLIFLGAIVAYQENAHLGVDTVVRKLSIKGRRKLFIANNIVLAITMGLCVHGTWKMTVLTVDQVSSSMQISLAFVYVSGFICSVAMVAISLYNLYRLITGKMADSELVMTSDNEDTQLIAAGEVEEGAKK